MFTSVGITGLGADGDIVEVAVPQAYIGERNPESITQVEVGNAILLCERAKSRVKLGRNYLFDRDKTPSVGNLVLFRFTDHEVYFVRVWMDEALPEELLVTNLDATAWRHLNSGEPVEFLGTKYLDWYEGDD